MTKNVDIGNRALQLVGTRTDITEAELTANQSVEAKQLNLVLVPTRDELLRMAPWNCGTNFANLTFITAAQGTPENPGVTQSLWAKGLPAPPWAYEYQYPQDCLRPIWIVPQYMTGVSGGVPISNAVTGFWPTTWTGPAVRFKVSIDQFFGATAAAVAAGGLGHAVNDIITLATPANGLGAPAQVQVLTVNGAGTILTCALVPIVGDSEDTPVSGSYFTSPVGAQGQGSTTGVGTGATFNLTMQATQADQRVILTNQENALCAYIKRVTDPNVMDELFRHAWDSYLAARLCFQLMGDKARANQMIAEANTCIITARAVDGNEGLTINDTTPDWIRVRGYGADASQQLGPSGSFDWGPLIGSYL